MRGSLTWLCLIVLLAIPKLADAVVLSDGISTVDASNGGTGCSASSCNMVPPTTVSGHLMIATQYIRSSSLVTVTESSSTWTLISNTYDGHGFTEAVWYKYAGASETSAYTFNYSGGSPGWSNGGIASLHDSGGNTLSVYTGNVNVQSGNCCGSNGPFTFADTTHANWDSLFAFYQNDSDPAYFLESTSTSTIMNGWAQLAGISGTNSGLLGGMLETVPASGGSGLPINLTRQPNDGGTDWHITFVDITGASTPIYDYRVRVISSTTNVGWSGGGGSGNCGMTFSNAPTSGDLLVAHCIDLAPHEGETATCPTGWTQFGSTYTGYLLALTCDKTSAGTESGGQYCGYSAFGTAPVCDMADVYNAGSGGEPVILNSTYMSAAQQNPPSIAPANVGDLLLASIGWDSCTQATLAQGMFGFINYAVCNSTSLQSTLATTTGTQSFSPNVAINGSAATVIQGITTDIGPGATPTATATATVTVTATPTATATVTTTATVTATATSAATPTATSTSGPTATPTGSVGGISYVYDANGRLVEVIDGQSGNTAIYQYDAVGNLLSIKTNSSGGGGGGSGGGGSGGGTGGGGTSISISAISPDQGPVGTQVTISGSGFSPTASLDSVSFNGATATITSATATQIVASVPSGATSGSVIVTSESAQTNAVTFTVTAATGSPSITGFTPGIGSAGTPITVSGTNFEANPSGDVLSVGGIVAPITSATTTTINSAVPNLANTGPISVTTSAGRAVSSNDFYVPPAGYTAPNVSITGQISVGGPPVTANFTSGGSTSMYAFQGSAGQQVSLSAWDSDLYYPVISILNPDGSTLASTTIALGSSYIGVQTLPATGTYTVFVNAGPSTGDVTLQLYDATNEAGSIVIGGSAVTSIVDPGQNVYLTFSGTAGQQLSLSTWSSNLDYPVISILNPDGSTLASTTIALGSSYIPAQTLPTTGNYTVFVDTGSEGGSITIQLYNATNITTAPIVVGGPQISETMNPGQNVYLTFSGTAGQQVSLSAWATNLYYPVVSIVNPDGSTLASTTIALGSSFISAQTLPATGTYTVFVATGPSAGGIAVQLYDATNITGPIVASGAPVTETMNPGQNVYLTFSGTAGQQVSLTASQSNLYYPVVSIVNPDGSTLASTTIALGSSFLSAQTLPATGTYTVFVATGPWAGSITVQLYDATSETGPIAVGGSAVTSVVNPGQYVYLTFSGTAGQQVSLSASQSNLDNPVVSILNPDGSTLASTTIIWSSSYIAAQTLPTTGTYTVFIDTGMNGGSVTVQLYDAATITGTITVGGNVTESVNIGQNVDLTFSGTAGQQVSFSAYNSNLNDPLVGILNPDLSTLASTTVVWSSAFIDVQTLPSTGTYTVFVNTGSTAGSITLALNDAITLTGPIEVNGAGIAENVNAGQNVKLTFSGTAGQQVTLNGYNAGSLYYPTVAILNPDGSTLSSCTIAFSSCSTGSQNLGSTGTYTAYVHTNSSPGSITLSVTSP
jgi:YD repeat-containing protein